MTPNLQPGKTAVLLVFQGKGAAAARKKYFGPNADSGSSTSAGGRFLCPPRQPCASPRRFATGSTPSIQYGARGVSTTSKSTLPKQTFASLSQSRTFPHAHFEQICVWMRLMDSHGATDQTLCPHVAHEAYRRLLPQAYHTQHSDEEVLFLTGLSDPSGLLRQQRLRHLGALYSCADSVPWGLEVAKGSFFYIFSLMLDVVLCRFLGRPMGPSTFWVSI